MTGLALAARGDWLRWLTPEGQVLPTPQELADAERRRAEAERQRASVEQQRAKVERQRAEIERQRAEAERQRADQAEELLEAYRRRFGPLNCIALVRIRGPRGG